MSAHLSIGTVFDSKKPFSGEEVLVARGGSKDDMQYGGGECADSGNADTLILLKNEREEVTKRDREIAQLRKERDDARLNAAATNAKVERARKALEHGSHRTTW